MEENQYNSMYLFEMTGNSRGKFAIRFFPDEILSGRLLGAGQHESME